MKIKIISVCVNYIDYLIASASINRKYGDITIITSPKDYRTQRWCIRNDIDCYVTDVFYAHGCPFNKGAAINEYLVINRDNLEFVLHLDSDTVLPFNFLECIKDFEVKKNFIYGCDRRADFLWYFGKPIKDDFTLYQPVVERYKRIDGLAGYFHLFNVQSECLDGNWIYPISSPDASKSDMIFTKRFHNWEIMKGMLVLHLGIPYLNWKGRSNPPTLPMV